MSLLPVLLPVVTPCHRNLNSRPRVLGRQNQGPGHPTVEAWGSRASNTLMSFSTAQSRRARAGTQAVGNSTNSLPGLGHHKNGSLCQALFPKNRQATGMSRTLCQGPLKPPACQGSSQIDHTGVAGPRLTPRHCRGVPRSPLQPGGWNP